MKTIKTSKFEQNALEIFAEIAKEYKSKKSYYSITAGLMGSGGGSVDDQVNFTDRNQKGQPFTIFEAGQSSPDSCSDVKKKWQKSKKKKNTDKDELPKNSI